MSAFINLDTSQSCAQTGCLWPVLLLMSSSRTGVFLESRLLCHQQARWFGSARFNWAAQLVTLSSGINFKESYKELKVLVETYWFNSKYVEVFLYLTYLSKAMLRTSWKSWKWASVPHFWSLTTKKSSGSMIRARTPSVWSAWNCKYA